MPQNPFDDEENDDLDEFASLDDESDDIEEPQYSPEELDAWYEKKSAIMEEILGPEHDMVMHAIIPYSLGGGLDLYYYPNDIEGTGIATKELSEVCGTGSSNDVFDCYELVMFTRHKINLDDAKDESTPFGNVHMKINSILNCIAPYSADATLNPGNTCEFPIEMEDIGGKCLIFDSYNFFDVHAEFGLMLVMEVFRSEMDYAREFGTDLLISKLIEHDYYPYSDMDRPAVV